MLSYPIILSHDTETNSVVVAFVDIPWCHSVGDDREEALLNAEQALESALSVFNERRQAVPLPSATEGEVVILPALVTAKVFLWNEMLKLGLRKTDLARRLNCHLPQVDRLLDFSHSSKIEQVEQALHVIGKRLDVRLAA